MIADTASAIAALSALAHVGRLEVFRLLVRAGPAGLPAGEVARATDSRLNTLSTNLGILSAAGLVGSRREGRSVIYSANYASMSELLAYLVEDCCGGNPDICAPLAEVAGRCCAPGSCGS
jgi:DNA-binding transcriptional ArsR family regulator